MLFLYISLLSLHGYNVIVPNFTFSGGREHKTKTFRFLFLDFALSFIIQLQKKKLPTIDKLNEMEKAR